jgi:hypothetical protein
MKPVPVDAKAARSQSPRKGKRSGGFRLPREEELATLAQLAGVGVHRPGERPFLTPWTDGGAEGSWVVCAPGPLESTRSPECGGVARLRPATAHPGDVNSADAACDQGDGGGGLPADVRFLTTSAHAADRAS